MPSPFVYRRRVQFHETDLAGIVHFSNFYRYMEEAEHAFLRSRGLKIKEEQADGTVLGWPRVRANCSFELPAYYEDELDIEVRVDRIGVKSLSLAFRIRRGSAVRSARVVAGCWVDPPACVKT